VTDHGDRARRATERAAAARERGEAAADRERLAHKEADEAATDELRGMHEREDDTHRLAAGRHAESAELQDRHAAHERAAVDEQN
jgi:hypothetical protein